MDDSIISVIFVSVVVAGSYLLIVKLGVKLTPVKEEELKKLLLTAFVAIALMMVFVEFILK